MAPEKKPEKKPEQGHKHTGGCCGSSGWDKSKKQEQPNKKPQGK